VRVLACLKCEPDRDTRGDDEQALEEIRRRFARYRRIARHGMATERDETPEAPAEDADGTPVLARR
jgi:hypothetical protein